METTKTFFSMAGAYAGYGAKWIIWLGRKYPLFAAAHLALAIWFLFFFDNSNQTTNLPPPVPPVSNAPSSFTPSSSPVSPTTPVAPVLQAATVRAIKDGNTLTVKWNQPVEQPKLFVDGRFLAANCQPQFCTVVLDKPVQQLQARWEQSGQPFEKTFAFR